MHARIRAGGRERRARTLASHSKAFFTTTLLSVGVMNGCGDASPRTAHTGATAAEAGPVDAATEVPQRSATVGDMCGTVICDGLTTDCCAACNLCLAPAVMQAFGAGYCYPDKCDDFKRLLANISKSGAGDAGDDADDAGADR